MASLEGWSFAIKLHPRARLKWAGQDSNLRRSKTARFTVWCNWPLCHLPARLLLRSCPPRLALGEASGESRTHNRRFTKPVLCR